MVEYSREIVEIVMRKMIQNERFIDEKIFKDRWGSDQTVTFFKEKK